MKKIIAFALLTLSGIAAAQETKPADSAAQTQDIQEVILKSQRKKQFVDRSVYTFDQAALDKARYASDLLKTLPELQYDPISNSVTSIKGGTTLMLINGIEATELQVRSIPPENVVRVEYYDNPPTRWATRADTVVNVITRNPETGYSVGADVSSALNTGFVNGSAYAGYTKGKNNLGLEYSINLRDYDDRKVNRIYDYQLDEVHYRSDENKTDHFGYTYQDIALRYTNSVADRYAFQAKLNMEIFSYFSKGNGQSIFTEGLSVENHGTQQNGGNNYTTPVLDLYYSKNIGKKDEVSLNVVGSAFTTNSYEVDKEWILESGESVFDNDMKLKAKQKSVVGEIAHSHQFETGKLSSGYRISNNNVSNELNNLSGFSSYEVNYLTQYMYTEFSGKKDKWMYRAGLGLTNIHNKSGEATEDSWTLTPKLILGYTISKNQSLRLNSSYTPYSPGSSALSSNLVQVVPNIVSAGNPYLKSQKKFGNNLTYSYNNKYFDFNANAFYWYTDRTINQYYRRDADYGYVLTYENADHSQQYGIQLTGSVKPFGSSLLVIKAVVGPASETLTTADGHELKNDYIGNYFVLSSEYKNFSIQYQFNIPQYTLNGAFLSTNENQNHIFASYKHNNWSFSSGMYWIGMPSEYKTKSRPESLVNYSSHTQIMNNKSMFILGLGFDFATGKKNDIDRKLNNSTAPAATF